MESRSINYRGTVERYRSFQLRRHVYLRHGLRAKLSRITAPRSYSHHATRKLSPDITATARLSALAVQHQSRRPVCWSYAMGSRPVHTGRLALRPTSYNFLRAALRISNAPRG